ncbi:histone-like transcription factor and archaeal histone family protein [Colletotrichum truncatum]|uniref:Histone-like transcription factor and archaeal histone family protein n=1 Tax=Colletotrichum truncatum TaxID=5467 RepID=A0ACC3ZJZ0_COLTU|nr:histone-like transcription factor and archaeal histone family protein [Colletotrichum truncatum]KAF6799824.1 histone-like transcription factor and archaeal histone family protein [Colletotrichum truncatum]
MPYNTNVIPPRKEVTGQPALPLARVKKIIGTDPDIGICSNNAAFVITLATEMFIQYLANEGQNMAKLDRKPRRNVQYKDLANAVNHHDNLEFLEDVIPKTIPYKKIKDQAAISRTAPKKSDAEPKKRQSTNGVNGAAASAVHEDDPSAQLEAESRQAVAAGHDGDVDMTG